MGKKTKMKPKILEEIDMLDDRLEMDEKKFDNSNEFEEFVNIDEDNPISKIVEHLFSDKNMEKKTELERPLKWSALKMIEDKLETKGLNQACEVIRKFRETSFRYLVSHKRKGIKELIQALQALTAFEKEREIEEIKSITGN